MDTNLARSTIKSLTPHAFGPHDVQYVRLVLTRLTGSTFCGLRNATIEVTTTDHENDTLTVAHYMIQAKVAETKTIAGPRFVPSLEVAAYEHFENSEGQLDVVDLPLGTAPTLHDAMALIAHAEVRDNLADLAYLALPETPSKEDGYDLTDVPF